MAFPPKTPITFTNKETGATKGYDSFELLADSVSKYMKQDGFSPIDFTGYEDTVNKSLQLKHGDVEAAYEVMTELNVWTDYLSSIIGLIEKFYLDGKAEKSYIEGITSISADRINASNGNRIANASEQVRAIRRKRNTFQAFYNTLLLKNEFIERAHNQAKLNYRTAIELRQKTGNTYQRI